MTLIPNGGIALGSHTRYLLSTAWQGQTAPLNPLLPYVLKGTSNPDRLGVELSRPKTPELLRNAWRITGWAMNHYETTDQFLWEVHRVHERVHPVRGY